MAYSSLSRFNTSASLPVSITLYQLPAVARLTVILITIHTRTNLLLLIQAVKYIQEHFRIKGRKLKVIESKVLTTQIEKQLLSAIFADQIRRVLDLFYHVTFPIFIFCLEDGLTVDQKNWEQKENAIKISIPSSIRKDSARASTSYIAFMTCERDKTIPYVAILESFATGKWHFTG